MIYLVQKVDAMSPINNKAKDVCKFCIDYEGCLLTSKADFDDLIETIRKTVKYANGLYPRTKPFHVTTNHDNYIHIEVEGGLGTSVVRFHISKVTGVYNNSINMPISYFVMNGKEVQL